MEKIDCGGKKQSNRETRDKCSVIIKFENIPESWRKKEQVRHFPVALSI